MKKIKTLIGTLCFSTTILVAQQGPTNTDPVGVPSGTNDKQFWSRAGNTNTQGTNNIFGTIWNSPVYHYTGGLNRMALFSNVGSNGGSGNGALAINHNPLNPITAPTSLLNIGEPNFFGQQPWMRVGTTYGLDNDMAYFGLKREGVDRVDAIIAWGNDQGGTWGPDVLRFHHTSTQSEMARFAPNGGNGFGNFYIYGINTQPVRRVEILDADPNSGANTNAPQLRTTYTYNATPTAGVFTEFQTTSVGDMYFNTRSNGNAKNFGFHKFNPLNTVEISAQLSSPYLPTAPEGSSGLRFTALTSANNTIPNGTNGVVSTKVLTVDGDGDVVLTDANATPTTNNGISITSGIVQLGVDCSSPIPVKVANRLLTNRMIHLGGNNMIFADGGRVGIGQGLLNCAVGNKLEINSGPGMPYWTVFTVNGSSGLRLTHLTSAKTPIANGVNGVNVSKVLSVDANGDVVLVDASSGLGNICGSPTIQPLINDWEIPMNGKNYTFSDPTTLNYGENTVRIGAACNNPVFNAKLEVIRNVNVIPSTIHTLIGVGSVNNDNFPTLVVGDKSYAGYFLSEGGSSISPTNYSNYGVVGIAKDARVNYGGYFEAIGPASANYGIYAKAISTSTTGAGPLAGYFDGDVIINGPFSGYSNQIFSDKNIKTGVATLKTSMDIINKLRPVSFKYDNSYAPQVRIDNNQTYGFIAQEVGDLIPELVRNIDIPEELDSLGNIINPSKVLSTLNYDGLIPFAIGGIQELNIKQKEIQAILNKEGLSDAQVKTNVNTFNALATVKILSPVKYNFTNANVPQLNFKPNTDYGFIAQQLETVYPELVDTIRIDATYDSLGVVVNPSKVLKTVNYKAMSALLVRSIQEQQLTIDSLRNAHSKQDSINQSVQQQLAALASQINSCCSNTSARNANSTINQLDVELSDKDAIVLNQNVPNPFAEQTTITYNVPTSVEKAQLIFFNAYGQVIQTVDIKTRGKGKVNVFAADLSSGLYHYSLVADGKVVDSKKMVRE